MSWAEIIALGILSEVLFDGFIKFYFIVVFYDKIKRLSYTQLTLTVVHFQLFPFSVIRAILPCIHHKKRYELKAKVCKNLYTT